MRSRMRFTVAAIAALTCTAVTATAADAKFKRAEYRAMLEGTYTYHGHSRSIGSEGLGCTIYDIHDKEYRATFVSDTFELEVARDGKQDPMFLPFFVDVDLKQKLTHDVDYDHEGSSPTCGDDYNGEPKVEKSKSQENLDLRWETRQSPDDYHDDTVRPDKPGFLTLDGYAAEGKFMNPHLLWAPSEGEDRQPNRNFLVSSDARYDVDELLDRRTDDLILRGKRTFEDSGKTAVQKGKWNDEGKVKWNLTLVRKKR